MSRELSSDGTAVPRVPYLSTGDTHCTGQQLLHLHLGCLGECIHTEAELVQDHDWLNVVLHTQMISPSDGRVSGEVAVGMDGINEKGPSVPCTKTQNNPSCLPCTP